MSKENNLTPAEEDLNWLQHVNDPPSPGVPADYKPPVFAVEKDKTRPVPPDQMPQPPAPASSNS